MWHSRLVDVHSLKAISATSMDWTQCTLWCGSLSPAKGGREISSPTNLLGEALQCRAIETGSDLANVSEFAPVVEA